MEKEPRYVVCRQVGRKQLWYWQRKGFKSERLSDDRLKRKQRADALNSLADRDIGPQPIDGDTVREVIRSYEKSDRYANLATGTKTYYNRYLREFLRVFGHVPFRQLSRRIVVEFVKEGRKAGEAHKIRGVISVLFDHARFMGLVEINQAEKLNLPTPKRRGAMWEPDEIEAYLKAAATHDMAIDVRRFFQICRFTAQRPGDVLSMNWSQYDGQTIKLRQRKTGKLVDVPCHYELQSELDAVERRSIHMFAGQNGKPYTVHQMGKWERSVRLACALDHLQMRDLRRTAMVRMAEAGAEVTDIAAVSGHTIAATVQILETYIPRTKKMAGRAILAWEVQKPKRT